MRRSILSFDHLLVVGEGTKNIYMVSIKVFIFTISENQLVESSNRTSIYNININPNDNGQEK